MHGIERGNKRMLEDDFRLVPGPGKRPTLRLPSGAYFLNAASRRHRA